MWSLRVYAITSRKYTAIAEVKGVRSISMYFPPKMIWKINSAPSCTIVFISSCYNITLTNSILLVCRTKVANCNELDITTEWQKVVKHFQFPPFSKKNHQLFATKMTSTKAGTRFLLFKVALQICCCFMFHCSIIFFWKVWTHENFCYEK